MPELIANNSELPNLAAALFNSPELPQKQAASHPPRTLLLYGSVRERSYSGPAACGHGR